MNRIHATAASVIIGLSAVFGVAATTKTAGIGEPKPAASKVSNELIAARQRKLNRAQRALRKARAQKPPALLAAPQRSVSAAPAPARVITQAAPVVPSASAPRSFDDDHEREDEHEDEFDDD